MFLNRSIAIRKQDFALFLLGLLAICCPNAALAGSPDYNAGVQAYNRSDFKTAAALLQRAVASSDKYDAVAHYFLANSLLQLNQRFAAISQYKEAYRLDPNGRAAKQCESAIARLLPGGSPASPEPAAVPQLFDTAAKPIEPAAPPEVVIHGLPAVPVTKKSPTLSEFIGWQAADQLNYLSSASERKTRALEAVTEAQEVMKKVQGLSSSAVPNSRLYGESDKDTAARITAGRTQLDKIVKPYEDALDQREKALEQANSIYQTCLTSRSRLRGNY